MPHERATRSDEVGASRIQIVIHKEIFLLPTEVDLNLLHVRIEELAYRYSCLADSFECLLERCLVIESLTGIGDEDGGDAEAVVKDEYRRRGIPGSISTSLKSGTNTAGRET